jgi:hypothetical protein
MPKLNWIYAEAELGPGTIAAYRSERDPVKKFRRNGPPIIVEGETIKATTINRELSVLRAVLNYALETDKRLMFRKPSFPIVR